MPRGSAPPPRAPGGVQARQLVERAVGVSRPRLVVFDLDACCWYPEMYMMSTGSPFTVGSNPHELVSRGGERVRLLGEVAEIWGALHELPELEDTLVGVASRCDVPEWGRECLQKLIVGAKGESMWDIAGGGELVEIYKSNKQVHFQALQKKTGISFEDMLFFDDDMTNIRSVGKLGVKCVHTPHGVTAECWEKGLGMFEALAA